MMDVMVDVMVDVIDQVTVARMEEETMIGISMIVI